MPLPAGIKEIPVESRIKTNMLWETRVRPPHLSKKKPDPEI
jgi:hypothetical protein